MAVLPIALMGNPILKQMAEPIIEEDPIEGIVSDMLETLDAQDGRIGLAAPQVSISKRIVIYRVPKILHSRYLDPAEEIPLTILINPILEALDDTKEIGWEACLSLPGLRGKVIRSASVRCTYTDLDGHIKEMKASGFHARLLQHECDHLDGILYPYRMPDLTTFGFESELNKIQS